MGEQNKCGIGCLFTKYCYTIVFIFNPFLFLISSQMMVRKPLFLYYQAPGLPMSPLVKSSSFDKSIAIRKKKFELHPSTPDSYKDSMPGPSVLKTSSPRPSLEKVGSLALVMLTENRGLLLIFGSSLMMWASMFWTGQAIWNPTIFPYIQSSRVNRLEFLM